MIIPAVFQDVCEEPDSEVCRVAYILALSGWRRGNQEEVIEDLYGTR